MTSAKEIASLKPEFIKIPSACNTHYEMLQWLCDNYKGEIQLSFGMTTHEEEEHIVSLFEANGRAKDLVLFDCTSGYPVPYEDRIRLAPASLSVTIHSTGPGRVRIMPHRSNLMASRVSSRT